MGEPITLPEAYAATSAASPRRRARRQQPGVAATSAKSELREFAAAATSIASGLIEHPANDGLRAALANGSVTATSLYEQALRMLFANVIDRAAAKRGVRLPVGLFAGQENAVDEAAIDRLTFDSIVRLLDSSDSSGHDLQTTAPARDIGGLYERLLAMAPLVEMMAPRGTRFTLTAVKASRRRAQGSFYTPASLVQQVLTMALEPVMEQATVNRSAGEAEQALLKLRVCDPACGTGNFLLAAAQRIATRLQEFRRRCDVDHDLVSAMRDVITHCIFGVDIDPLAVQMCRALLTIEAGDTLVASTLTSHVRCGNALLGAEIDATQEPAEARRRADAWCAEFLGEDHLAVHWRLEFPEVFASEREGFDVVLGNPPFLNQLETDSASSRGVAQLLRERSGGAVRGYADIASAFLLLATEIVRPGGFVSLVQPQSLLATRDAAPVRKALLRNSSLNALWIANEHMFEASVHTCAPVLQRNGPRRLDLSRSHGSGFNLLAALDIDCDELANEPTWAHLVAEASGIPAVTITSEGVIGDVATVTADFRDQYYGLDGCIIEDADLASDDRSNWKWFPPLLTTGLIDLAANAWGMRPTRILKRTWQAPRIDRARLECDPQLASWLKARVVPKILLATQTRVIEVTVDAEGCFAPAVPLITIVPRDVSRIWHIAAALASPLTAAFALRTYAGTAMSADAIKLAARQVAQLPLPAPSSALDNAAAEFQCASRHDINTDERTRHLHAMAESTLIAFNVPIDKRPLLMRWWKARLLRRIAPFRASSKRAHDV